MSKQETELYEFGPFRLDRRERLLWREGEKLPLTPKAFDTLLALVRNSGHLMLKDELMKAVWPDSFVEEVNLSQNISLLRKTLGDTAQGSRYIVTVPGRGYRFVGEVREPKPETDIEDTVIVQSRSRTSITVEKSKPALSLLVGSAVLILAIAPVAWWVGHPAAALSHSFEKIQLAKLTHDGSTRLAAISPDGSYVAYVRRQNQASLWVRQIATDSTVQLIAPLNEYYESLSYSPDGNYVYFTRARPGAPEHFDLYLIPSFGGVERRVLLDVNSALAFSPDGSRLAFLRRTRDRHLSQIVVADSDGGGEHVLSSFQIAESFEGAPAWSPNGKVIAVAARHEYSDALGAVLLTSLDGGKTESLPTKLVVTDVAWLPDGSGLLETGYENGHYFNHQIWLQPYPKGQLRRITNDLSSYLGLTVSRDGKQLATMEERFSGSVFVGPASTPSQWSPIKTGKDDGVFLEWLKSGDLFLEDANFHFAIAHADGSDRRQMSLRDDVLNAEPAACGQGRFIVLTSFHQGRWNLFKLDPTSQELTQLTNGSVDDHPACSNDGQEVVFDTETAEGPRLRKFSFDAGTAAPLSELSAVAPRFSPDGKFVAFWLLPQDRTNLQAKLAIMDAEHGRVLKTFDLPEGGLLLNQALMRWAPGGQAITYALRNPDGSLFWSQPIAGGRPQLIAKFSDPIFWYDFSPDGKQIAMTRGQFLRNVVLIKTAL